MFVLLGNQVLGGVFSFVQGGSWFYRTAPSAEAGWTASPFLDPAILILFSYASEAVHRPPRLLTPMLLTQAVHDLEPARAEGAEGRAIDRSAAWLRFVVKADGFIDVSTLEIFPPQDAAGAGFLRGVIGGVRFEPARHGEFRVRTTVTLPLRWDGAEAVAVLDRATWNPGIDFRMAAGGRETWDPYDDVGTGASAPELLNADQVMHRWHSHVSQYLPDLRDPSVGSEGVRLRVYVDEQGRATAGKIVVVETPGHVATAAAVEALRLARFRPAMREGQPVARWMPTPLSFTPD